MSNDATRTPAATRPVLAGFYPDPSVCRVDDVYYLVSSSFEYAPGLPIHRSTDLVTWELVGHALDRPSQLSLAGVAPSGGVYAPTLRHHDGRFWLITTNVTDGPGQLLVTATDPAGPWSEPVRVRAAGGIDPDLAWDADGTCYLTWSDAGIWQAVLDPETGELLSEPRTLWSGSGGKDPEGPHLYEVAGTWYLLVAEGGTGQGHAVSVARAPAPSGPFEPSPHNPVLTARGTNAPVQNTGHADLVERTDGTWAAVYLAVRPAGYFPSWHVLGRETFATHIDWVDGWPRLGAALQPDDDAPSRSELGSTLPADWVGSGVFPQDVLQHLTDGPTDGWRLTARDDERTFVGHRQRHPLLSASAEIDAGDGVGGLELRIDPTHAVTIEVDGPRITAVARVGTLTSVLGEAVVPSGAVLELRVEASPFPQYSNRRGPDQVTAAVDGPDGRVELGRLDGRYLSAEVAGGFTGRMVGLVCSRGSIDVRSYTSTGTGA